MFGLYPIIDTTLLGELRIDVLAFARAVLSAKPAAVQLRCKDLDASRVLELARDIAAVSGVIPFFVNDRPDLAILSGATGVHLGQGDLAPVDALRLSSLLGAKLRIGRSTHGEADLVRSNEEPIDYVAIGPIFATPTKKDHAPVVGVEALVRLAQRSRRAHPSRPVVAIGGITEQNIAMVAPHVDAIAVVSAILDPSGDVEGCTRRLDRLAEVFRSRSSRAMEVSP